MVNSWLNKDGLFRKFGPGAAGPHTGGEYDYDGPLHMIEVDVDLTKVVTTDGGTILDDQVFFPKNARIEKVEILVLTAATGTGAVLNLGLIKTDRSTEIDFNGFAAAVAQTAMAAQGDIIDLTKGATGAGALIGTVNANSGYMTADYDTAAFTAGKIRVRIFYSFG